MNPAERCLAIGDQFDTMQDLRRACKAFTERNHKQDETDDIIDLSREKCHRKTAFCYIIMTIPVTLIWSTLNRFVSSVSSVLDLEIEIGWEISKPISDGRYQIVRPKIPRRDEMTSKNLARLFGRCRVTDRR